MEYISEFKYLRCVLDESGADETKCYEKMMSRRKVFRAIRSLINARDLQLEYVRVLS